MCDNDRMDTTERAARRRANQEAAERNRALRAQGLPTPWERAKAARRARRDELRAQGLIPPLGVTREEWELSRRVYG